MRGLHPRSPLRIDRPGFGVALVEHHASTLSDTDHRTKIACGGGGLIGEREHADAVKDAREHLGRRGRRPLDPLPGEFESTRFTLHRVAEELLKPKRVLETGNEIALRFTTGGFGTPPWKRGKQSGTAGQLRVDGTELVLTEGGEQHRLGIGDLRTEAKLLGLDPEGVGAGEVSEMDPAAAAGLADWFAFGTVALADLIERQPGLDPEPIRLWPEHFDVATVLGSEAEGTRANYGASPGDGDHREPYLYVGPWEPRKGELWNATAFPGAELSYADLLSAGDQLDAALRFFSERLEALTAD